MLKCARKIFFGVTWLFSRNFLQAFWNEQFRASNDVCEEAQDSNRSKQTQKFIAFMLNDNGTTFRCSK